MVSAIAATPPPPTALEATRTRVRNQRRTTTASTRITLSCHGFRRLYPTAIKRAGLDHLQLVAPTTCATFSTWLEDQVAEAVLQADESGGRVY